MYKLCVCEKCKGSFVVTKPTENEKLCGKCLNPKEAELTFEDSIDNENFVYDFETEVYKRSKKDLFIGAALKEKEFRNIAILFCRSIKNKYIELVGLDIFEGKVVKLVDENGKKRGVHTYKEEIAKFKHGDVISVPVKFVDECKCMNMLRISDRYDKIKLLRPTNIIKVWAKYENIYQHDICWSFSELLSIDQYEEFYCLIYFPQTRIEKNNRKLQISFVSPEDGRNCYVDCLDKTRGTKIGDYVEGLCLLKAKKNENSNEYEYCVKKNMAKILSARKVKKEQEFWKKITTITFEEDRDLPL